MTETRKFIDKTYIRASIGETAYRVSVVAVKRLGHDSWQDNKAMWRIG